MSIDPMVVSCNYNKTPKRFVYFFFRLPSVLTLVFAFQVVAWWTVECSKSFFSVGSGAK